MEPTRSSAHSPSSPWPARSSGAFRRPGLVLLLISWFALTWFFALGYSNADIGRYYLVPIMAAVVLGALAIGEIWRFLSRLMARASRREVRAVAHFAFGAATLLLAVPGLDAVPVRLPALDQSNDRAAGRGWTRHSRNCPAVRWW